MNIEKERMAFEGYVLSLSKYKKRSPKFIFDLDENGDYDNQDIYELHHAWQASANREGFVLVPKEPTEEMWGGLSRVLGRYMQSKERYCPKTLKRYLDMFAKDIPDWLNKEVTNWNSDHAFATADLPVFIYKAMIEAQEQSNESN